MKATTVTMSQPLRIPSAKTIAISLLQVLGFAAMLYAIAQICLFLSGTAEGYGENLQFVLRWAWVAPVPFYALGIGAKLAAEVTGNPSLLRSPWISYPALIVFPCPRWFLQVTRSRDSPRASKRKTLALSSVPH